MMKTKLDLIKDIKTYAEQARNARATDDTASFEKAMENLISAPACGVVKSGLINFITNGNCKGFKEWHFELLKCGLNENPTPQSAVDDLEMVLFFSLHTGRGNFDTLRQFVVSLCDRFIEDVRFYHFGICLKRDYEMLDLITPEFFKAEGWENMNQFTLLQPYEDKNYLIDDGNTLSIHPDIEMIDNDLAFMDYEFLEKSMLMYAAEKPPFSIEENHYQECFDQNDNPIMEKIEKAASVSTKAAHMLLKMKNKNFTEWFE